MAKAAIAYVNSVFGTVASSGSDPVKFTPANNPDGTSQKDTRK
jgi:hypothetical protein